MRALALLAAALLLTAAAAQTFTFNPATAAVGVGGFQEVNVTVTGCPLRAAPDDGTQAPVTTLTDTSCAGGTVVLTITGVGSFVGPSTFPLDGNGKATFNVTSDVVGTSGIDGSYAAPVKRSPETAADSPATTPPPMVKDSLPCTITWVGWNVTLTVDPLSVLAGGSVTFTATVKDSGGSPLAGETVTFLQEGVTFVTAATDSSGVATVTFAASGSPGLVTVQASTSITSETSGETIVFDSNQATYSITAPPPTFTFSPATATQPIGGFIDVTVNVTGCLQVVVNPPSCTPVRAGPDSPSGTQVATADGVEATTFVPCIPINRRAVCSGTIIVTIADGGVGSLVSLAPVQPGAQAVSELLVTLDPSGVGTFRVTSSEVGTSGIDATFAPPTKRSAKTGDEAAAPTAPPAAAKDVTYPCTITWVNVTVALVVTPTSVINGNNVTLNATVRDSNGAPVAGQNVSFVRVTPQKTDQKTGAREKDTFLGTATTDINGVATLEIIAFGSVNELVTVYALVALDGVTFESNLTEDTFTITPVWNLVAGETLPSHVQVPDKLTFTATLTEAGPLARAAGDPVPGQTVSFFLGRPLQEFRIPMCSGVTDINGVASCDYITAVRVLESYSVFAEVQLPDGGGALSVASPFAVDIVNDVVIQLSTLLAQPQKVTAVQRVTGTVTRGLLPVDELVFFEATNIAGLELVDVSCPLPINGRKQAPVSARGFNLCFLRAGQQHRMPAPDDFITTFVQPNGTAWIELARSTPGNTSVTIASLGLFTTSLSILGQPVSLAWFQPPIPAKVLIGPKKAYRRCYEEAQVVARVLDADGAPVPNQPVTFGVTGSCVPRLESKVVVTDARGYAHLSLTSSEPGVVAVVAATVGANGNAVLSRPSHIVFEEEERHYEGKAAAHTHGARLHASDAEEEEAQHREYAADAARLALAEVRRVMMGSMAA